MELHFERVFERDLDLLLMNLFSRGSKACELFYDRIGMHPDAITSIKHSVKTVFGESDLEVWFTKDGKSYALLIEDKINASAQPEQHQRYEHRKEEYRKQGMTEGFVFLVAPDEYIKSNGEAAYYDRTVGFDELLPVLTQENDVFGCAVLECGKLKFSDSKTPDEQVTEFWQQYVAFFRDRGKLGLNDSVQTRSANSVWPSFRTQLPGTVIQHKSIVNSERSGWADLQFTGKAKQEAKLNSLLKPYLDADMCPRVTGNSYSIGIKLEPMYFSESFAKYADQMETLYDAVARLQKLAARISENGIELP